MTALKKLIIFFPNTVLARDGLRGYGGRSRCQIISIGRLRVRCGVGVRIRQSTARAIQNIRISLLFYRSCGTMMSHRDHSVQRRFKSNTSIVYRSTYGKRAGGEG